MRKLNIFVDETGEMGFGQNASELYGISFTFHEQDDDISKEIAILNDRLKRIGYEDMIHMGDLVMKRGSYKTFSISIRKSIFYQIYHFSRKIPVKYKTIIVDKKYVDNIKVLKKKITEIINQMLKKHEDYFQKFDKIVMYYDNGQKDLGRILDRTFSIFENFEHQSNFNHKEMRLFQVSDMLTYIDKYDYKYKNKRKFTKGEKYFWEESEIKRIIQGLSKKRLK